MPYLGRGHHLPYALDHAQTGSQDGHQPDVLGELVAGLKTARRFGAELKLLNVGERVYSTLDMARLLPTFEIFEDEEEAVRSFGTA